MSISDLSAAFASEAKRINKEFDNQANNLIAGPAQELKYQRDNILMQAITQKIGWQASDDEIGRRCHFVVGPHGHEKLWVDGELVVEVYPPAWAETTQVDDPAQVKYIFKQSYRWLGD